MSWVKWDNILLSYEGGGLNIGSLKAKNLALLCKWWWRFHTESNAFWVNVIRSIYGWDGGLGEVSNNLNKNSTWNNIRRIGNHLNEVGIPLTHSFRKFVNNGDTTLFWKDKWLGDFTLEEKFGRLSRLEQNLDAFVADRISVNGTIWAATWDWSRTPSGRTSRELSDLLVLLNDHRFDENKKDYWTFTLQPNGLFSTWFLTHLIDEKILPSTALNNGTMLNNLLPQKVGILIWRATQNRIPVRNELDKRCIDLDSLRCPVCDEGIETVEHILTECSFAKDLWKKVYQWWQFGPVTQMDLTHRFKGLKPSTNAYSKICQAIEWVCGYVIWENRNKMVFRKKKESVPMALNEVQVRSFEWISNRSSKVKLEWPQWILNPTPFDDKG